MYSFLKLLNIFCYLCLRTWLKFDIDILFIIFMYRMAYSCILNNRPKFESEMPYLSKMQGLEIIVV